MDRYFWLSDHQQHGMDSLAHTDDLITHTGRIIDDCTERGALSLKNVAVSNTAHVTVTGVAPIPQAVPRLNADALN